MKLTASFLSQEMASNHSMMPSLTTASTPSASTEASFLWMEFLFGLSMFVGCFLSYILPIKLMQRKRHRPFDSSQRLNLDFPDDVYFSDDNGHETANKILRWCNCFGAGIFVSVCFLGVMPVVHQEFDAYFELIGLKGKVYYPVAELTTLLGFFLVLFLEEAIHLCQHKSSNHNINEADSSHHEHVLLPTSPNHLLTIPEEDEDHESNHEGHKTNHNPNSPGFQELNVNDNQASLQDLAKHSRNGHRRHHSSRHHNHNHHHSHHSHSHVHSHHMMPTHGAGFTFFILMFATRFV